MNGFTAQTLAGNCLSSVPSGGALDFLSCHMLYYTTITTGPVDKQSGLCGNAMILPHKTAGIEAILYGANDNSPAGYNFDQIGRFDLSQVSTWLPQVTQPYPIPEYTVSFEGPRFTNPSTYIRLAKRNQITSPFENLEAVDWVDAAIQDYGQDWLGNFLPGGWCYSNLGITEPMNGEHYYEDARKITDPINMVDRTQTAIHSNWTPFCNALPVYDSFGGLIGSYDGLAWIVFFNAAGLKNPIDPPPDYTYTGPLDPPPKLDPRVQMLNLEVWVYLTANSPTNIFKSPRVGAFRYWTYTRETGDGTRPFSPYFFFNGGAAVGGSLVMPINFPLLSNANNPTLLASQQVNLVLSNFKIHIGA